MPKSGLSDQFKPEMPDIPGVSNAPRHATMSFVRKLAALALAAIALFMAAAFCWRALGNSRRATAIAAPSANAAPAIATPDPAEVVPPAPSTTPGETIAATVQELSAPWSEKAFTFVDPKTGARLPAMIVRLPESSGTASNSYWAFLLEAPLANCQLDYVASPAQVASSYAYHATHPMVVAPCDGTVFDPLRFGTTPEGAWARGAVVQGSGIRPPLAVEIRIKENEIVAERSE